MAMERSVSANIFDRCNKEVGVVGRFEDRWLWPQITVDIEKDVGINLPPGIFEHELQVRLFIRFRGNQAEYRHALAHAERAMLHFMYKDALDQVALIRKGVYDRSPDLIFDACAKLEKAVGINQGLL